MSDLNPSYRDNSAIAATDRDPGDDDGSFGEDVGPGGDSGVGPGGDEGAGPAGPRLSPRTALLIGVGVAVLVALAGLGFAFLSSKDDATNAGPGDCLTALDGIENLDIRDTKVDCADSAAAYKVLGIVDQVTFAQASDTTCVQFPASNVSIWIADDANRTGPGQVVCLQSINK